MGADHEKGGSAGAAIRTPARIIRWLAVSRPLQNAGDCTRRKGNGNQPAGLSKVKSSASRRDHSRALRAGEEQVHAKQRKCTTYKPWLQITKPGRRLRQSSKASRVGRVIGAHRFRLRFAPDLI